MALNFHGHPRTADMSGTITLGGTAQTLSIPQTINHEVTVLVIHNPDASEDLWFAPNGVTAAPNGQGSVRVPANGGNASWHGDAPSGPYSLIGATTGHKFTAWGG